VDIEEFWRHIDWCGKRSSDIETFNKVLEDVLQTFAPNQLPAFHDHLWKCMAEVQRCDAIWEACGLDYDRDGDWGERYAGWVVAQGREFYDAALHDPQRLGDSIVPTDEDEIFYCDNFIFAAACVYRDKTGNDTEDWYRK
jgi:hypothetical protein